MSVTWAHGERLNLMGGQNPSFLVTPQTSLSRSRTTLGKGQHMQHQGSPGQSRRRTGSSRQQEKKHEIRGKDKKKDGR